MPLSLEARTLCKRLFSFFVFVVGSIVLAVLTIGCEQPPKNTLQQVAIEGRTMGTYYHVKVVGEKESLPPSDDLKTWTDEVLESVNRAMSTYIDDSELSEINRATDSGPIMISRALYEVLHKSQQISALSDGAFDITVYPLVALWGFGADDIDTSVVPSEENIAAALASIGYEKLVLDQAQKALSKPAGLTLDLSAIAKGYGVDLVSNMLREKGYLNHMVEVGGEVRLNGVSQRGTPWRIGVEQPSYNLIGGAKSPALIVELSGKSMATSGDYRNYYEVDGERFSHTIDPTTGRPIKHNLASVTVISDDCATADALATAFNVMGVNKAMALSNDQGIAAFFIVKDKEGFTTLNSNSFEQYMFND